jgi:GH18 family chitinase
MKTSVIVGALGLLAACSGEVGQSGSGPRGSTASGAGGSTGSTTGAGGTESSGAVGSGVTVGTTGAGTTTGTTTGESSTTGQSTTTGASGSGGAGGIGGSAGSGGAGGGSAGSGGTSRADAGVPRDAGVGAPDVVVTTPDTKVVMYLPNWSGSFATWATKIDFNKMTHLLLAFGVVDTNNNWNLGAADNDVKTLAAAAHAKNVKILVSIGGADDDLGIITQYQTQSNINPLAANLDAFVSRLNLDGVDVDLERGAQMKSSSNYPAFVSKLVSTFRPEGKLVTTALAQYIVEDAGVDATIKSVLSSFDFINLMIYSTNSSNYTNELGWWTANTGVAKNKLTWGIDFSTGLTTTTAAQLTTSSKAYGGIMVWEYSQRATPQLWPAVQGAI